jgi:hypothetical protein
MIWWKIQSNGIVWKVAERSKAFDLNKKMEMVLKISKVREERERR